METLRVFLQKIPEAALWTCEGDTLLEFNVGQKGAHDIAALLWDHPTGKRLFGMKNQRSGRTPIHSAIMRDSDTFVKFAFEKGLVAPLGQPVRKEETKLGGTVDWKHFCLSFLTDHYNFGDHCGVYHAMIISLSSLPSRRDYVFRGSVHCSPQQHSCVELFSLPSRRDYVFRGSVHCSPQQHSCVELFVRQGRIS